MLRSTVESVIGEVGDDGCSGILNVDKGGKFGSSGGGGGGSVDFVNNELVNNNGVYSEFVNNNESEILNESNCNFNESNVNEFNESLNESVIDDPVVLEDANDPDYVPFESGKSESDDDCSDKEEVLSDEKRFRNERTLLVYESKLYELLQHCPKCGANVDTSLIEEVQNTGSQLHLKINCFNNCDVEWKSQPTVGKMKGLGNLYLATSIAFSGLPFAKVERFAWLVNLKFMSDSLYYQIKRDYIMPVI